jgi:hypothetical protein
VDRADFVARADDPVEPGFLCEIGQPQGLIVRAGCALV